MNDHIKKLEPTFLWSHFADICSIPHPSKKEEKLVAHIKEWTRNQKYECREDEMGNLVIAVPATPGMESVPTVILQGHLDMVCEKNAGTEHDFDQDPLKLEIDGDWISAAGTTLGADNGIGVAAGMAVADDPEIAHGPLELLMTLDEETGLTGAQKLDPSILTGKIMLNLDTEEDGALYIGCAGGADVTATFSLGRRDPGMATVPIKLNISGLRGGHSGLDIDKGRGNALKLIVRLLNGLREETTSFSLVDFQGGSKHNAIPREAFAIFRLNKHEREKCTKFVNETAVQLKDEFAEVEPGLEITLTEVDDQDFYREPLTVHSQDRILNLLTGIPHGVLAMSLDVPGLVETSNNLAILNTTKDRGVLTTSQRSSVMPKLMEAQGMISAICRMGGAKVDAHGSYPGWKPNPNSPILKKCEAIFNELYGEAPKVKAIHAGLECGLLLAKIPDMDIISIGPEIHNAHSPDEQVQISSTQRFYSFLGTLLSRLG